MKKLLLSILATIMLATSANAAVDNKEAQDFVKYLTKEGVEKLVNSNLPMDKKEKEFKKLFDEAFDLNFIGRFVLGRYWRQATPEQKTEFMKEYKEYNVRTWSARFDEFKGRSFEHVGVSPSNSKSQVFVETKVNMGEGMAPATVLWRVAQEKSGKYRVVDIVIENVSLAITARNEYTAFVKNNPNGIDALIEKLRD